MSISRLSEKSPLSFREREGGEGLCGGDAGKSPIQSQNALTLTLSRREKGPELGLSG